MTCEKCFACGRALGRNPARVDTRDGQTVFVGADCFVRVMLAGNAGYRPPTGGPKLYPMPDALAEPAQLRYMLRQHATATPDGQGVGVYTRCTCARCETLRARLSELTK